jgi:hypothetical protein
VVGFITDGDSPSDQLCQLEFIHHLWSGIKQSFGTTSLAVVAETVLSTVLSQKYRLEGEVKAAWSALCSDLISIGVPDLMCHLLARSESQGGIEVQRQLWAVMAENELFKARGNRWEEIVSFLAIPIR